ncbi:MAG TPA: hypothetical protein VFI42_09260 [Thermomicrobiaceae bacterium]|nr:hypothetical protein [Thermomicrobiaceae bacterium]
MSQETQQSGRRVKAQQHHLFIGARAALVAGVIVGIAVVGSQLFISAIYSQRDSRALVAAMASPASTLSSSIITGLATILALMLTMLSLSQNLNQHLSAAFYTRVKRISVVAIADMIAGIVLLLILSSPIQTATQQSRQASPLEITLTYYALIALAGIVAGLFVAVIVMLYNAVTTVVEVIRPDRFSDEG